MENTNFEEYFRDRDWRQLFITMRSEKLKKKIIFLSRKLSSAGLNGKTVMVFIQMLIPDRSWFDNGP
ncbi:hypothetical protein [Pedobacter sp. MR2016-24]|uniref:hypothetical protein n=1 Tax=Pedobacter sp. MR2016-24 TaxID=2994466 RepID=UPI0022473488|nr:hypothetical protein [Pedobacter sp. MR2016-24]